MWVSESQRAPHTRDLNRTGFCWNSDCIESIESIERMKPTIPTFNEKAVDINSVLRSGGIARHQQTPWRLGQKWLLWLNSSLVHYLFCRKNINKILSKHVKPCLWRQRKLLAKLKVSHHIVLAIDSWCYRSYNTVLQNEQVSHSWKSDISINMHQ